MKVDIYRLFDSNLPGKVGMRIMAEYYFNHVHPLRTLGFIHKPTFMKAIDDGTATTDFGDAVVYLMCALAARYMCGGLKSL